MPLSCVPTPVWPRLGEIRVLSSSPICSAFRLGLTCVERPSSAPVTDPDQHDSDAIRSATRQYHLQQLLARRLRRRGLDRRLDLGVADMRGESVGAQDEDISGHQLALLEIDHELVADANGMG